ncbi:MAG TPA: dephospho-CoA kinase [Actinomycetota bacterium]|nr:dephospho-CoA kinase [Actinomycetota bacterium]
MPVIGLTGGIASGKSTVADLLRRKGAVVIDADAVAHEVVEPGQPALEEIRQRFGDQMLREDGSLDRAALGRTIFLDEQAREGLNEIMHPRIFESIQRKLRGLNPDRIVVYEAALLVETYEESLDWLEIDAVVVVDCPVELQLERLVTQRGMSRVGAELRIAAQGHRGERLDRANYVLDNSGSLESLRRQVDRMWLLLQNRDPDRPLLSSS